MPVTDQDVAGLVYFAERLRTETYGTKAWDKRGIELVFARDLKGTNLRIALEEVIAHACDPSAQTPAAIRRPFKPEPGAPKRMHPPKRDEECEHHMGQYADNCGGCTADHLAGDTTPRPHDTTGTNHEAGLKACRDAIVTAAGVES